MKTMMDKIDHIVIFEDEPVTDLSPFTLTRPAWDLLFGADTLLGRLCKLFPDREITVWVRDYLAAHIAQEFPDIVVNKSPNNNGLLVNSRLVDLSLLSETLEPGQALYHSGFPAIAAFDAGSISELYRQGGTAAVLSELNKVGEVPDSSVLTYPWGLMEVQESGIWERDFDNGQAVDFFGDVHPTATIKGRENIRCGIGANVGPYTVLDASTGPITIGRDVEIGSHVVIQGPVYIGDNAIIKPHSWIRENTSIGRMSKVGGEISGSIIHAFSNKQHSGFMGNSVVGSWCNLGAGTTTSNLKNNYANVKVQVADQVVDTGRQFVGSMIGDHSTTAIGTMLNTGTVVGVGSFIYGAGLPEWFVPSFQWGIGKDAFRQDFEKSVHAIQEMMTRRGRTVTDDYRQVLEQVYEMVES